MPTLSNSDQLLYQHYHLSGHPLHSRSAYRKRCAHARMYIAFVSVVSILFLLVLLCLLIHDIIKLITAPICQYILTEIPQAIVTYSVMQQ